MLDKYLRTSFTKKKKKKLLFANKWCIRCSHCFRRVKSVSSLLDFFSTESLCGFPFSICFSFWTVCSFLSHRFSRDENTSGRSCRVSFSLTKRPLDLFTSTTSTTSVVMRVLHEVLIKLRKHLFEKEQVIVLLSIMMMTSFCPFDEKWLRWKIKKVRLKHSKLWKLFLKIFLEL